MANITAQQVKELRDATNISMMECKRALVESNGDFEGALKVLKERGLAVANKRSGKEANEGVVSIEETDKGVFMLAISCETDFVAGSDDFKSLITSLTKGYASDGESFLKASTTESLMTETIAKCGEKIVVSNSARMLNEQGGVVSSYVHGNKRIGVIITLEADKELSELKDLARDLSMQIAAMNPIAISQADVNQEMKDEQIALFTKQLKEEGKTDEMIAKIVVGKVNKYFSDYCLEDMSFIKDDKLKIKDLLSQTKKRLGLEKLLVKEYKRFQIGG